MTDLDQSLPLHRALARAVAQRLVENRRVNRCAVSPTDWQRLLLEVIGWPTQVALVSSDSVRPSERHSLFLVLCGFQVEISSDPSMLGEYRADFNQGNRP